MAISDDQALYGWLICFYLFVIFMKYEVVLIDSLTLAFPVPFRPIVYITLAYYNFYSKFSPMFSNLSEIIYKVALN